MKTLFVAQIILAVLLAIIVVIHKSGGNIDSFYTRNIDSINNPSYLVYKITTILIFLFCINCLYLSRDTVVQYKSNLQILDKTIVTKQD